MNPKTTLIIKTMIENPGLYLCGDTKAPDAVVPIYSTGGALHAMKLDQELEPDRFLDTLTVSGPFVPAASAINDDDKFQGVVASFSRADLEAFLAGTPRCHTTGRMG